MQTSLPLFSLNAAFAWPVPLQILNLPCKAYDAPTLEAQALYLLNKYQLDAAPQDIELKQLPKLPLHTFGRLDGLRCTAELESSGLDEKLIAPCLIRKGCEGMAIRFPRCSSQRPARPR